ncbi:hypothetical protein DICVIV_02335 [Dictyocaulus viviparus]|uniref:ACB domain-containing protein n=1 Tax=Dictyocaulus viviparus TaxID=29172 RepID=A0A0D8Y5N4_DICVI|nr:hypothetical protein DICVIV_02335 [Dictyocaulus viviparus]
MVTTIPITFSKKVMDDSSEVEAANNNHVKLSEAQLIHSEFGAPLEECYKLAVKYYKEVMDDSSEVEAANNNHVKLSEAQLIHSEFGAPLEECYKLAVKYYKDKEKSGELSVLYEDRVNLMALNKQVRHGPFADNSNSAGWFDIFGNDVTKAWRNLGQRSRIDSMASFVFLMDRVCPPFKKFITDHVESNAI